MLRRGSWIAWASLAEAYRPSSVVSISRPPSSVSSRVKTTSSRLLRIEGVDDGFSQHLTRDQTRAVGQLAGSIAQTEQAGQRHDDADAKLAGSS